MERGLHEPTLIIPPERPSERSTGLVFAGVAFIVAFLARSEIISCVFAASVGVALCLVSFIAPGHLGPLNRLWFRFALLLNGVTSPILMFAIFALGFVPLGLLMRLRRDPLMRKRRPCLSSYWVPRDPSKGRRSMTNQF